MRMLRTNQSNMIMDNKETGSHFIIHGVIDRCHQTLLVPNHAARVNVSRNAFFSSRSEKNTFFDVDIVVKSNNVKIEIWFIVVYTLIDN